MGMAQDVPVLIKLKAESSEDAQDVYADGASYQNGGKFEIAIEEWVKFRDAYSDDPLAPKSIYYLGICSLQLKKYDEAAAAFEFTATRYEKHENSEAAYFYWGRTRYAQALGAQNAEKRMTHFGTAISAFGKQLELFEKGPLSDQAFYLRGESFYNQDDKTKAIADYRAVVTGFPKSAYRQDAIYVLGATLEEEEKYKEAGIAYDLFLKEFPESGLRTEVRMRKAESMLQDDRFEEAAQIFAEVAAVEGFEHATRSRLRQAFCLVNLEQFDDASAIYQSVFAATEDADHKKTTVTQLNVLCRKYIEKKLYSKSLALAQQMIEKAETEDSKVRFKMAAADSFDGQAKYGESRSRYLAIATDHEKHVLAPDALYFAAFAAFQLKEYDDVLSDASVFREKYADHEFTSDVSKLVEESRVLKSVELFKADKFAETIELLTAVVKDEPKGKRVAESLLLLARSQARLEKYDDAKASIGQLMEGFPESKLLPEAIFRLGEYHFVDTDFDNAITHFTSVIDNYADSEFAKDAIGRRADVKFEKGRKQLEDEQVDEAIETWNSILAELEDYRLAHAVLYEVAFALRSQNKHDEARKVFTKLVTEHKDSDLAADSFFRLGEYEYDGKNYTQALQQYGKAFASSKEGGLQELILHKLGWASFRNSAFEESGKHFAQQLEKYAEGELAKDGKFMQGESLFKQNKYAEALLVFEPLVEQKFDSNH
ncbi:MAG: tetratricopeptide repeat protein, partial [Planctomycetota bacterium]|nr:tetratricopeptide repeat protein [Planctomycetota bacterium]